MSTLAEKFKRDIKIVSWLALGLFVSLALFSYNPADPSLNSTGGLVAQVHNYCGIVGSFLADILYQFFGMAAWGFVALIFRVAYVSLRGAELDLKRTQALFSVLFVVSASSLMALYIEDKVFLRKEYL